MDDKLSNDKVITGDGVIEETPPKEQEKDQLSRTSRGRFRKGHSGNKNGRPKKGESVVERFRSNEKVISVIEKLFKVANTLGTDTPDKDALSASKLIIERIVPSLKASEMRIDTDNDTGLVFLPSQEEPDKE